MATGEVDLMGGGWGGGFSFGWMDVGAKKKLKNGE